MSAEAGAGAAAGAGPEYPEPAWRHSARRGAGGGAGGAGGAGGMGGGSGAGSGSAPGGGTGRSTPRPEGGGRAAGGDAPAPARQWPILLVVTGTLVGLAVTATGAFRGGILTIGVSLLAGAVLRWAVRNVGMLAVRSRFTDVITYGVLGVVIVLLALMAQPDPVIRIPFLEDIIHFSVR